MTNYVLDSMKKVRFGIYISVNSFGARGTHSLIVYEVWEEPRKLGCRVYTISKRNAQYGMTFCA